MCFIVLPADISDDAVREHFAECGDVVAVRIVRDRQTGMGKGFGYILFEVRMYGTLKTLGILQNLSWDLRLWPFLTFCYFGYVYGKW